MSAGRKERRESHDFVVSALAGGDITLVVARDGHFRPKVKTGPVISFLPVDDRVWADPPEPDEALVAANRARIAELRTQRAGGPVDLADILVTREGRVVVATAVSFPIRQAIWGIAQAGVVHGVAGWLLIFPLIACPCVLHLIAAPVMAIGMAVARWPAVLLARYAKMRHRRASRPGIPRVRAVGLAFAVVGILLTILG